jgi:phenylalanyl-tRNA synthetase beta chain
MKISYNWLKQYINLELEPEKVSELLTDCGLEVERLEKVQSVKGGLEGVIIGKVVSSEKHPDADKLTLTTVDIGRNQLLSIVCGAPNVKTGQKVPVAPIGTKLFFNNEVVEIQRRKVRGELSEGMICAEDELGLGASHDGIMELDPDASVGMTAREYFNITDDYVFEIGLTPNRTDAMSHLGVARDLMAVINNLPAENNDIDNVELLIPSVDAFKQDNQNRKIEVEIVDTKACGRYSGVTITGIEVGESPEWLKTFLSAIDIRPINNIVDISNYVLFETGQPLHIFDADEITGGKVVVKKPEQGTKFTTLDEVDRELSGNDLMICNLKEGMCIAGVFGGIKSGVTEKTKDIFIESAYFNPRIIRKTAKYHGLQTDSSFRFERGTDPNGTVYALKRAGLLIKELTGGEISSEIIDIYPKPFEKLTFEVAYANVDRLIGKKIPRHIIESILVSLGIEVIEKNENGFRVLIPTYKTDVTREVDVIEEILRIYGYNTIDIPENVKSSLSYWDKPNPGGIQSLVSDYLTDNGFYEMMNNSLTSSAYIEKVSDLHSEKDVKILNPISKDLDVLRQTLLFGGLESINYNINRQSNDLKFYEFGNTYFLNPDKKEKSDVVVKYKENKHLVLFLTGRKTPESWYAAADQTDFYTLKATVNNIIDRLGINRFDFVLEERKNDVFKSSLVYRHNDKLLVEFGLISPLLTNFDIKQDIFYADFDWGLILKLTRSAKVDFKDLPKYPEVRRDLALLLSNDIQFSEIEKIAYRVEKKLLKRVSLFDVFEGGKIGKGMKSYAVSFILQDRKKTLTDKEINKIMNKLIRVYQEELHAIIR